MRGFYKISDCYFLIFYLLIDKNQFHLLDNRNYVQEMRTTMENANVLIIPENHQSDFYILYCGYAECNALHNFGPAVRPNYLIHYVLSGKGSYYVGDNQFSLQKGQGFIIEPNVLTRYQAAKDDPWTYIWIGFSGEKSNDHLRNLGLGSNQLIFQSSKGNEIKKIILEMLEQTKISIYSEYRLQGLFYLFLSLLAEDTSPIQKEGITKENTYIRKSISFIQTHYNQPIKVSDIAHYVSLNRCYLSTLFQKSTGTSIQKYLSNFRITRASELLQLTYLSIEQIAESCGYTDPLVFSKASKKIKGVTPSIYRKINVDKQKQLK